MRDTFGIERVLQPRGAVPVTAWKVDNSKKVLPNEARIKVERVHIELDSFQQICSQCDYDESKDHGYHRQAGKASQSLHRQRRYAVWSCGRDRQPSGRTMRLSSRR